MDFTTVKCKLSRQHFSHYNCIEDFLADIKLVFINCSTYNTVSTPVLYVLTLTRAPRRALVLGC